MRKCGAKTKNGSPCKGNVKTGEKYCFRHNKESGGGETYTECTKFISETIILFTNLITIQSKYCKIVPTYKKVINTLQKFNCRKIKSIQELQKTRNQFLNQYTKILSSLIEQCPEIKKSNEWKTTLHKYFVSNNTDPPLTVRVPFRVICLSTP